MSSRRLLLLFLAFLALYAAGDWALPLVDRDEPRFAEASREMLERGDFIVPYFNNQTRFDKPPLIYWLRTRATSSSARMNSPPASRAASAVRSQR